MMPVRRTQNWLPSIFDEFFDNDWLGKTRSTAPAINVLETAQAYKIELAVPGMTKNDFNVNLDHDNNLVIDMEKKTDKNDTNARFLRREFSYTKFQQTMIMPENVDCNKITANVENGILTIELPKFSYEETHKPGKKIEIS